MATNGEKKRGPKTPMTQDHKDALALGRTEGRAIRNYMGALSSQQPRKRGRVGRSAEDLRQAIADSTDPMERLRLRPLLRAAEEREFGETVDMEALEAEFAKYVVAYSERNGLTYGDWREEGVAASVLKAAGMKRGA